jgi:ABC-type multidrug transport system permease subunit
MKSVFDIRNFFFENNAADYINTTMLIRHAMAFGAYMIMIVLYFSTLCYWGWTQTPYAYDWVMISGVIFNAGEVFSQVLLCKIIADLGKKLEATTESQQLRNKAQ